MSEGHPGIALGSRSFGCGRPWLVSEIEAPATSIGNDVKLFATTFIAGFVFVSLLLA